MLWHKLTNRKKIGDSKEQEAKRFLQQQGLTFVEQNYHCRFGEIDLIFSDPNQHALVFVEVRYRNSAKFGGAAASVTPAKQAKIRKAALSYMTQRQLDTAMRFDVIAFEQEQLNWHQSAFS